MGFYLDLPRSSTHPRSDGRGNPGCALATTTTAAEGRPRRRRRRSSAEAPCAAEPPWASRPAASFGAAPHGRGLPGADRDRGPRELGKSA
ncbi:hypothetical protein IscW_ISCW012250 [Ixodes scapularis]|uniref:Uncharacterized protein n=1 Tax=Ixodes scapularis TaxID=6945 RepID=B7QAZ5_IXOSC|nr:hypothetical protein IscW_ISCW012250 [Ixodes scapularis]|eukprot:XP_002412721.1 hypothetical protein IscW_ISCW012250 [Ixodes scapularis]